MVLCFLVICKSFHLTVITFLSLFRLFYFLNFFFLTAWASCCQKQLVVELSHKKRINTYSLHFAQHMFTLRCWVNTEAATLHTKCPFFPFSFPCPAGRLDRDQMEEVCVAGSHLCTHPLPSDRRGPHPVQLQPLSEGRCAKRMAAQPAAGPEGALALLVGGRPQFRWSYPPRACRWEPFGIHISTCR